MKLSKLYIVFAACFNGACQCVVCAMRLLGSMPSERMNHACPQGEHTRLSAYVQCSKRDRHSLPTKSRALINYNAAWRANVESACVSVLNTGKSILLNRFIDCICSKCLFSFYCDDKDKCCDLSVIHY